MIERLAQVIRRRRRWLLAFGLVVALYAAAGFLWLPSFARHSIQNYVQNELHRKISIGALAFNPLTLTARVESLALNEADETPIARFDLLIVNAELSSLIRAGIVCKEIRFENPHVSLRVDADGSLNLAKLAPPNDTATASPNAELPSVRIGKFALHRGRITLEDRSRPKPFTTTLAPIEFSLDNFRTEPKFGNAYKFVAATADGERLEWSGEFSVQPLGSAGRFTLNSIKAATIAAYLQDALPFHLPSGSLDLEGNYRFTVAEHIDLRLQFPAIKARDVSLALRGGATEPWIAIPELTVSEAQLSLADRTLSIGSIAADEATMEAWRLPDNSVNLAQLFSSEEAPAAQTQTAVDSGSSLHSTPTHLEPWRIDVNTAELRRAHVKFADRSVEPHATLVADLLDVAITNYSNKANRPFMLRTNVTLGERGNITVSGPVKVAPLAATLEIAVQDFDLTQLQPYAAQSTDMTIRRGRLHAQTKLQYDAEPLRGKPHLKLTGNLEIANWLTKDNALEEDFIKWQSVKVAGLDYQRSPDRLSIAKVAAIKPYGRIIVASNGTLNVASVLNPTRAVEAAGTTADDTTAASPPQKAFPARIRSVTVENGSASFADYSVQPSFATDMAELNGSVEGLSSDPDSRAKLQFAGNVDRYAPVTIQGEVNLLSTETYSDIALSFRNIELTTFNPYSGKFAGYNITKGKLSTEMSYKVEHRSLDARHHVVIDQLEFGAATGSKDAVSLPVKLAVALLKDRHGVIDLDLPVNGNLDDPKFRLGPIVWQVLKNTLEKIVTAPFALLGRLFGGGEELAFVDFAHGTATLTPATADKLGKLRQAMIERPQLRLDVPMRIVNAADATALVQAALENAIASLPKPNPDRLISLTAVYVKEFGKNPVFPDTTDKSLDGKSTEVAALRMQFLETALLTKFATTPAALEELGRNRGTTVRDTLLTGGEIAADRVFLSTRSPEGGASDQFVRMELKLE